MSLFMPEIIEQKVYGHLLSDDIKPAGNYGREIAETLVDFYVRSVFAMADEDSEPYNVPFEGEEKSIPVKPLVNYVEGKLGIPMDEQDDFRKIIVDNGEHEDLDSALELRMQQICQQLYAHNPSQLRKMLG